jgi:hypothetical protein
MSELTPDRLLDLQEKIEQQRKTVEALTRDGHPCPDAERQLRRLLAQLQASENVKRTA